jgi:hypothetical protein
VATVDTQTLIARIGMMVAYENLRTLEKNIVSSGAMDPEIEAAIKRQYGVIARGAVAERTGIDLSNLSPAEERIVLAVAEYVGLLKRDRKDASRTFQQLKIGDCGVQRRRQYRRPSLRKVSQY